MKKCKCGQELPDEAPDTCLACRKKAVKDKMTTADVLPSSVPSVIVKCLGDRPKSDIVNNPDMSLFLHGRSGVGKSHQAAVMMFLYCVEHAKTTRAAWANVPDLLLDIRQTFNNKPGEQTEWDLVKYYSEVNFLCLDDLGVEKSSDFAMQTLYLIINRRYENMRTTVITSNLSLSALADKLEDDRLTSRILGMCQVVELTGKDRRKK